ncbi:UNKNOWN [Stylonychia lemnae]|uniref:Uncharacterized protein n=1 Tax=Stylonychia lemnae TaxID=5949 RepID=A0A078AK03_STYLE|nr:UNKNOWN [Stylonychia lemnae]|eukprot:CDW82231.1 UNKNOWN [Stylonychia lemnae]
MQDFCFLWSNLLDGPSGLSINMKADIKRDGPEMDTIGNDIESLSFFQFETNNKDSLEVDVDILVQEISDKRNSAQEIINRQINMMFQRNSGSIQNQSSDQNLI